MTIAPAPAEVRSIPLRPAIVLFVLVWLCYGAAIKKSDLKAYNLQQMGIDALVEHGTFEVGQSEHPRLQPRGDVFEFEGHLYPAKQPGQFVVGALAYTILKWLGLSYSGDYVWTASWITWLSASSFAALLPSLLLVLLVWQWGVEMVPSLAAALVLAFGTHLFAYSGVAHHDVIASSLLLAAFLTLERGQRGGSSWTWFAFGVICGLVLFVSMLPTPMVMVFVAASLVAGGFRRIALVGLGLLCGLLPLGLHNWTYFNSPLVQANMAGGFKDTFFNPSWSLFRSHLWSYLGLGSISLWLYAPAAGAGLLFVVAAVWRDASCRRSAAIVLSAVFVHLAYILSIQTVGGCQFGPRYLLPCLGFAVAGCALQWNRALKPGSSNVDRALGLLLVVVALASITIGVAGARVGTMVCDRSTWVPARGMSGWPHLSRFPLALPMATALSIMVFGGLFLRWARERARPPSGTA